MNLHVLLMPRRLLLVLITILALALRLWGLGWGQGQPQAGEWGWRVVEQLGLTQPSHPGLWPQAFYSLAALLYNLTSWLLGLAALVLGQVRYVAEVGVSALMAGRAAAALCGAAQAPLAYLLSRRVFNSPAAGLLAAGLVAVSPLLVAQSHYLALGAPLGLMVLVCMWAAWRLADLPSNHTVFWAGFAVGLCAVTAPLGGLMLAPTALAFWLGLRGVRAEPLRAWLIWPALGVGGLALGLIAGSPGLVLEPAAMGEALAKTVRAGGAGAGYWAGLTARVQSAASLALEVGGAQLVPLWLVAVAWLVTKRQWRRLLLAVAPPLFIAVSLAAPWSGPAASAAGWLPAVAVLAVWPLVLVCRWLPSYGWQVAAASTLGMLLTILPLWRSAGLDYLFWQQAPPASASFWLEHNLPTGVEAVAAPETPLWLHKGLTPWGEGHSAADLKRMGRYLVVCPAQGRRPDAAARMLLAARFDLAGRWAPLARLGRGAYPPGLSPPVEVYAPYAPQQVRQPLSLEKPAVGWRRDYAVVYGDAGPYGKDDGVMLIPSAGRVGRALSHRSPLDELGVTIKNMGEDLAVVQVRQGPWPHSRQTLYPGQSVDLLLPALRWPPMARGVNPVWVMVRRGGQVWADVCGDRLRLGRRALERGQPRRALDLLLRAPGCFEADALRAGAMVQLGQLEQAKKVLFALHQAEGSPAQTYARLADAPRDAAWDADFGRLTGYQPQLLRRALAATYQVKGPPCLSRGRELPLTGEGYHGVYQREEGQPVGSLRLWLDAPLPRAPLAARLNLAGDGHGELARAELWTHGPGGARLQARRAVTSADLGRGPLELGFRNRRAGARAELRLIYTSPAALRLDSLELGVDLQGHMRSVLRWYHDAWGRVHLADGRYAEAVQSFEAVLALDKGFHRAYLPLARGLIDSGKAERALDMVRQAEEVFISTPDSLARVLELYKTLQRPEAAQRVEERLAHLRPSLSRDSRFDGGLSLIGVDMPKVKAAAGGVVDVNFYWKVWATPPVDYYIFVHLEGPGRVLNYDHLLDHGRVDMTALRPGQVVREDFHLRLPEDAPPGVYRLKVGLWDARFTRKAMEVLAGEGQGGNEITLAEVEVTPPGRDRQEQGAR